jgi:hypothetical protein
MASRSGDILLPLALGGVAGILAGLVVWRIAASKLEKSLQEGSGELSTQFAAGRTEIRQRTAAGVQVAEDKIRQAIQLEVRPAVIAQVATSLSGAGLTPETLANVRRALDLARRAGVI